MTPFDKAFEEVKALADKFHNNLAYYIRPDYQEAEARADFIDKFFIAMGWDVKHDHQHNPYEQEVKVEKSQKQQESKAKKRADYAFYLAPNYKDPRFFVEAKKPSVELKHPDNYFQIIRYGFNSNTPIGVLTDFEQFHIIDCRNKADIETVFNGQHKEYRYTDYSDKEKFAEIYYLFSREAVLNNSLTKYAEQLLRPRGKAVKKGAKGFLAIDDSFLQYIDAIREDLAKAFKKNDEHLNSEQLTEAVTRTIDRLVFVRFLEDKLIEPVNHVSEWGGWKEFITDCRKLDVKYNGIVFKKHFIDDQKFTGAEERIFLKICKDISDPYNSYLFSYIPIHILGSIYEQFLGKVVIATDKRVRIDEKPEVRKAGGVYYTPKYIVDYIVQNTVGKAIETRTPKQISELRFADIACGSGSFLIGVYDCLLDYHKRYYVEKLKGKTEIDGRNEDFGNVEYKDGIWVLTLHLKQDILLNNIFGVDIDHQAVEVTQLSLFLKMLEDETVTSTHVRQGALFSKVLPDLSKNIVCGNSIIGTDVAPVPLFSFVEEKKLNPLDYETAFPAIMRNGGFDAIIGNPPFIQLSSDPELNTATKKYLINKYRSSMGRLNTFGFFTKRAMDLLKVNKRVGYIIPNTITTQEYYEELREMILDSCKIISIVNFDKLPFKDAVVENVILILETEPKKSLRDKSKIAIVQADENGIFSETKQIIQDFFKETPKKSFSINFDPEIQKIKAKISLKSKPLGSFLEVNQAIALKSDRAKWISNIKKDDTFKPLLVGGKNINRYSLEWDGTYLKYDLKGIHSCKREDIFLTDEKILFRRVSNKLIGTIDTEKFYGLHTLVVMNLKSTTKLNLKFLLGLFNSSLLNYFYKATFASTKTVFSEIGARQVQDLPIKDMDLKKKDDQHIHDKLVNLVTQMLDSKKQLQLGKTEGDKTFLENKFASLDKQVDNLVYQLYGLTDGEIEIVESSN